MFLLHRNYLVYVVIAAVFFCSKAFATVVFEPGVGVGVEYTDNAGLTRDDQLTDTVTVGYVGARVFENEGALRYDANASLNNQNYLQDTFPDQDYYNLEATADWEMIRNRFNWTLSEYFYQRPIITTGSNTPDNVQDSNVFSFGADIFFPVSARQTFSLIPMFTQYYYEVQLIDNKQYSLAADWNYQMSRLMNTSINFSIREIDYTEEDILGQSPEDTTFTNLAITFNSQRQRSSFVTNLGATNVKRELGEDFTGFAGYINWLTELSARSSFETLVSTDITDTSSVAVDFESDGNGVQLTADVIRNSLVSLVYQRDDGSFNTRISARYNEITYSDNPLDRVVRDFGVSFRYPVTRLLSSGAYLNYNREKRLETDRLDKRFTARVDLRYNFSRRVHGLFDIQYRKRESTYDPLNYDEFSVFLSLVYGFGDVLRPTRIGGF